MRKMLFIVVDEKRKATMQPVLKPKFPIRLTTHPRANAGTTNDAIRRLEEIVSELSERVEILETRAILLQSRSREPHVEG